MSLFLSKSTRQQRIRELIFQNGRVLVGDLCLATGVSEATIRRDLEELAAEGVLLREHGGASRAPRASPEPPIYQRRNELEEAKGQIGRAAADLVGDGETVFLGSGSTVLAVAQRLRLRSNLTVISNSLPVINTLCDNPGISVIVLGGLLRASELSMIGYLTEQAVAELRADKVIVGMRAVDIQQGLTSDYLPETMTDRSIVQLATQVILVADHSKFGRVATAFVAPITVVHTVVTDAQAADEVVRSLRSAGCTVIVAGTEPVEQLPARHRLAGGRELR